LLLINSFVAPIRTFGSTTPIAVAIETPPCQDFWGLSAAAPRDFPSARPGRRATLSGIQAYTST
jgi:hypothetical protein